MSRLVEEIGTGNVAKVSNGNEVGTPGAEVAPFPFCNFLHKWYAEGNFRTGRSHSVPV